MCGINVTFQSTFRNKYNKMTHAWFTYLALFGIFKIPFICYAELSIPTRNFELRVPQAKPTKPETYVSRFMPFLLCSIKRRH